MSIAVEPVTTRAEREAFLKLPWRLYANDPLWVPPLLMERRAFLDSRHHPFYLHGDATPFVARRNGEIVGRILASDDRLYNERHPTNSGNFGLFESINDQAVADALLDTAAAWIRARGRTHVMGPIDYNINYNCGLLTFGFDTPPRMMMNHNPPFYADLLERWGLTKAKDLLCWWLAAEKFKLEDRLAALIARLQQRAGYIIRPARMNDLAAEVRRLNDILNATLHDNWGFVPLTEAELDHLVKEFKTFFVPELLLFAEHEGRPVGFSLTMPDVNEVFKHLDGRLFTWGLPIGVAKLFYYKRKIRAGRMIGLGVLPEFRRKGIIENLILRTYQYGKNELKYIGAELGWTLEDNDHINSPIRATGSEHYKTYRIYEKTLS